MTTKRFTMFAIIMAAFVFLVGCQKEKTEENSCITPSIISACDMLQFKTSKDLFIYLVNAETNNEREGFVSFGKKADDAYYAINPEEMFNDMDEVIDYVLQHRELFQLILGSDGEYTVETRLYNHPFRNIANEEGVFQVGDSLYKIIEGGLAYTSIEKKEELVCCADYSYYNNNQNICYYQFNSTNESYVNNAKPAYECTNNELYNEKTVGNNRITLQITNYSEGPFNSGYDYLKGYNYLAKPYHKSIGWWGCNRTISGTTDVELADGGIFPSYYQMELESESIGGSKLEFHRVYETLVSGSAFITSARCTATTPDSGTVVVNCNHN